jgi:membrane protease YdiL (CAAX protease family)
MWNIMSIKLRPLPILLMLTVTLTVALNIYIIYSFVTVSPWLLAILVHIPQFLLPFLIILYLTAGKPGEYGFNLNEDPPEFSHKRMLFIGLISGVFLSIPTFIQIMKGIPIHVPQPLDFITVLGNLGFQWIIVGLSEETMFRGLIQTYLMNNLEGYVDLAGNRLHIGTIIAAIFWGGFHIINLLNMPLSSTILTILITTPIGLLMGYAFQRTRSLLTTILVHNTLFGVPLTISYILYTIGF